ncbi:MAG: sulfatase [Candidatus Solibacter sp.]|nr:sulfatase [Candidatus Solibacter sp.]
MASEKQTRREWLEASAGAAVASSAAAQNAGGAGRPNILLIISDQFRWDCIGAMGLNPMNLTPNLDRMASRGCLFRSAISNQPVCAPARASIFTGQYAGKHGVWRNSLGLAEGAVTIGSVMKQAGYSTNYIGKWHLAPAVGDPNGPDTRGFVKPQHRGGFQDLWEAANVLEMTSHAYEGDMWDGDGKPLHFADRYRADFMTDRAQLFLRSRAAKSPFLLTLSYLEVHHQNDKDTFDPPKEFAGRYPNPFIPQDLRPLPGSWPSQIADYFACVAKMDEIVGTLRQTLVETGLDKNTIVMFTSDHGNHFRTRNAEYKRSPHESSIHIPLVVEGPGFNRGVQVPELVSHVDFAPTLLSAAGIAVPASMQGRNFLPLLDRHTDRRNEAWRDEVYFEMSEFITGRGLRTPQYTYAVAAPKFPGWRAAPTVDKYVEYMLYDLHSDPFQQVNLAGRAPYQKIATELRQRLRARMREASGEQAAIEPAWFPYS